MRGVQPEALRAAGACAAALTADRLLPGTQVWGQQQHHVLRHPRKSERADFRVAVPADLWFWDPERGILWLRIGWRR